MTNTNKLKAKIIEKGYTLTSFAKELKTSKTTLSQKVNNKFKFSQTDMRKITEKLELTGEEVKDIFLN